MKIGIVWCILIFVISPLVKGDSSVTDEIQPLVHPVITEDIPTEEIYSPGSFQILSNKDDARQLPTLDTIFNVNGSQAFGQNRVEDARSTNNYSKPHILLHYFGNERLVDKEFLLGNLDGFSGPMVVTELPNRNIGHFEFRVASKIQRKKRDIHTPLDIKETDNNHEINLHDKDDIKSDQNIPRDGDDWLGKDFHDDEMSESNEGYSNFEQDDVHPSEDGCSAGWECVLIGMKVGRICSRTNLLYLHAGTVLNENSIIRFVRAIPNEVDLVQIIFTSVDKKRVWRLGIMLYPTENFEEIHEDDNVNIENIGWNPEELLTPQITDVLLENIVEDDFIPHIIKRFFLAHDNKECIDFKKQWLEAENMTSNIFFDIVKRMNLSDFARNDNIQFILRPENIKRIKHCIGHSILKYAVVTSISNYTTFEEIKKDIHERQRLQHNNVVFWKRLKSIESIFKEIYSLRPKLKKRLKKLSNNTKSRDKFVTFAKMDVPEMIHRLFDGGFKTILNVSSGVSLVDRLNELAGKPEIVDFKELSRQYNAKTDRPNVTNDVTINGSLDNYNINIVNARKWKRLVDEAKDIRKHNIDRKYDYSSNIWVGLLFKSLQTLIKNHRMHLLAGLIADDLRSYHQILLENYDVRSLDLCFVGKVGHKLNGNLRMKKNFTNEGDEESVEKEKLVNSIYADENWTKLDERSEDANDRKKNEYREGNEDENNDDDDYDEDEDYKNEVDEYKEEAFLHICGKEVNDNEACWLLKRYTSLKNKLLRMGDDFIRLDQTIHYRRNLRHSLEENVEKLFQPLINPQNKPTASQHRLDLFLNFIDLLQVEVSAQNMFGDIMFFFYDNIIDYFKSPENFQYDEAKEVRKERDPKHSDKDETSVVNKDALNMPTYQDKSMLKSRNHSLSAMFNKTIWEKTLITILSDMTTSNWMKTNYSIISNRMVLELISRKVDSCMQSHNFKGKHDNATWNYPDHLKNSFSWIFNHTDRNKNTRNKSGDSLRNAYENIEKILNSIHNRENMTKRDGNFSIKMNIPDYYFLDLICKNFSMMVNINKDGGDDDVTKREHPANIFDIFHLMPNGEPMKDDDREEKSNNPLDSDKRHFIPKPISVIENMTKGEYYDLLDKENLNHYSSLIRNLIRMREEAVNHVGDSSLYDYNLLSLREHFSPICNHLHRKQNRMKTTKNESDGFDPDSKPDILLHYFGNERLVDKEFLLGNLDGFSGPMVVTELPNRNIGHFEFRVASKIQRKKRDIHTPLDIKETDNNHEINLHNKDDIKSDQNIPRDGDDWLGKDFHDDEMSESSKGYNKFEQDDVHPSEDGCSAGWECVLIGTVLNENNIIRFVRAIPNEVDLVQIIFTSVDKKRAWRLGIMLYPTENFEEIHEDDNVNIGSIGWNPEELLTPQITDVLLENIVEDDFIPHIIKRFFLAHDNKECIDFKKQWLEAENMTSNIFFDIVKRMNLSDFARNDNIQFILRPENIKRIKHCIGHSILKYAVVTSISNYTTFEEIKKDIHERQRLQHNNVVFWKRLKSIESIFKEIYSLRPKLKKRLKKLSNNTKSRDEFVTFAKMDVPEMMHRLFDGGFKTILNVSSGVSLVDRLNKLAGKPEIIDFKELSRQYNMKTDRPNVTNDVTINGSLDNYNINIVNARKWKRLVDEAKDIRKHNIDRKYDYSSNIWVGLLFKSLQTLIKDHRMHLLAGLIADDLRSYHQILLENYDVRSLDLCFVGKVGHKLNGNLRMKKNFTNEGDEESVEKEKLANSIYADENWTKLDERSEDANDRKKNEYREGNEDENNDDDDYDEDEDYKNEVDEYKEEAFLHICGKEVNENETCWLLKRYTSLKNKLLRMGDDFIRLDQTIHYRRNLRHSLEENVEKLFQPLINPQNKPTASQHRLDLFLNFIDLLQVEVSAQNMFGDIMFFFYDNIIDYFKSPENFQYDEAKEVRKERDPKHSDKDETSVVNKDALNMPTYQVNKSMLKSKNHSFSAMFNKTIWEKTLVTILSDMTTSNWMKTNYSIISNRMVLALISRKVDSCMQSHNFKGKHDNATWNYPDHLKDSFSWIFNHTDRNTNTRNKSGDSLHNAYDNIEKILNSIHNRENMTKRDGNFSIKMNIPDYYFLDLICKNFSMMVNINKDGGDDIMSREHDHDFEDSFHSILHNEDMQENGRELNVDDLSQMIKENSLSKYKDMIEQITKGTSGDALDKENLINYTSMFRNLMHNRANMINDSGNISRHKETSFKLHNYIGLICNHIFRKENLTKTASNEPDDLHPEKNDKGDEKKNDEKEKDDKDSQRHTVLRFFGQGGIGFQEVRLEKLEGFSGSVVIDELPDRTIGHFEFKAASKNQRRKRNSQIPSDARDIDFQDVIGPPHKEGKDEDDSDKEKNKISRKKNEKSDKGNNKYKDEKEKDEKGKGGKGKNDKHKDDKEKDDKHKTEKEKNDEENEKHKNEKDEENKGEKEKDHRGKDDKHEDEKEKDDKHKTEKDENDKGNEKHKNEKEEKGKDGKHKDEKRKDNKHKTEKEKNDKGNDKHEDKKEKDKTVKEDKEKYKNDKDKEEKDDRDKDGSDNAKIDQKHLRNGNDSHEDDFNDDKMNKIKAKKDDNSKQNKFRTSDCSPGWECARIGTVLNEKDIIRFVPAAPSPVGLVEIMFTTTDRIKVWRLGVLLNPNLQSLEDVHEVDSFDADSVADVITNYWKPSPLQISEIADVLHDDIVGFETLESIRNVSDVQEFFDVLKSMKQTIDILFTKKVLKKFIVQKKIFKTSKVSNVRNGKSFVISRDDSLMVNSHSNYNISKDFYFFAKFRYSAKWLKISTIIIPALKLQSRYVKKGFSLPPVPFEYKQNTGFLSQDIAEVLSEDRPGLKSGIALFKHTDNSIGSWEIQDAKGKWSRISTRDQHIILLPAASKIRFQPRRANTMWSSYKAWKDVRFDFKVWDYAKLDLLPEEYFYLKESIEKVGTAVISVCSDEKSLCKDLKARFPGFLSSDSVSCVVERLGCDGVKSSWPSVRLDDCGVCGGRNECIDCSGLKYGNASIDKCGICSGGNTSIIPNHLLDCGNSCHDENYLDECNFCQKRSRLVKSIRDCAGICFGHTEINSCGSCMAPNRRAIVVKDACGICGGNDGTCTGCDGIVNSGAILDDCGNCRVPDDPQFNSGCAATVSDLKVLFTSYVLDRSNRDVLIFLSGKFSNFHVASCYLNGSLYEFSPFSAKDFTVNLQATEILSLQKSGKRYPQLKLFKDALSLAKSTFLIIIELKASSLNIDDTHPVFLATPSCLLQSKTKKSSGTLVDFQDQIIFHSSYWPTINSITPNHSIIQSGPTNVTISGRGFLKNVAYECVNDDENTGILSSTPQRTHARYIDHNTVGCQMPRARHSGISYVYVLPQIDSYYLQEYVTSTRGISFHYREPAPRVKSAILSDNLGPIIIEFDKPSVSNEDYLCDKILRTHSMRLLGGNPACLFSDKTKLFILPSENATFLNHVAAQDDNLDKTVVGSITLKKGAITGKKRKRIYEEFPLTTIDILYPKKIMRPKVALRGPAVVSLCGDDTLYYKAGGSVGHWPLTLLWTLVSNDGVKKTWVRKNANRFGSEPIEAFEVGATVKYILQVQNALGIVSDPASHNITITRKPAEVKCKIRGRKERKISSNKNLKLKALAKVLFDKCDGSIATTVPTDSTIKYFWNVLPDSIGFSLNDLKKDDEDWGLNLFVPKGSLVPGIWYQFAFTAVYTFESGVSHTTVDKVNVYVKSQSLVAVISHSHYSGFVNVSEKLVLNGFKSSDPDRDLNDPMRYFWQCQDLSGSPCLLSDPNNIGKVVRAEEVFSLFQEPHRPEYLSIPAALFSANETYNISLIVNKRDRTSYDSVLLTIKQFTVFPPQLLIKKVTKLLSVSRIQRFQAALANPGNTPIRVMAVWSSIYDDEFSELSLNSNSTLTPITKRLELTGKAPSYMPLVLKKNVLKPGKRYKLRLTLSSLEVTVDDVIQDVDFSTATKPVGGRLEVEPAVGIAMTTSFTLRATGWFDPLATTSEEDDAQSSNLAYRFGYYREEGNKRKLTVLSPYSDESEISGIFLPAIGFNVTELELVVFVSFGVDDNIRENVAKAKFKVRINPSEPSSANEAFANINGLAEEALFTGDTEQAATFIAGLDDTFSHTAEEERKERIQQLADEFTQSLQDFTPTTGNEAIETLKSANDVFTRIDFANESAESASSFPGHILSSLFREPSSGSGTRKKRALDDILNSESELSPDLAIEILTTHDALLKQHLPDSRSAISLRSAFHDDIIIMMEKFCTSVAYSEPPMVVSTTKSKLIIGKNDVINEISTIGDLQHEVFLSSSAGVVYDDWNCTDDAECSGACLAAGTFDYNVVTWYETDEPRISDILLVGIFNPITGESADDMLPANLSKAVTIHFGEIQDTTIVSAFECRRWSDFAWWSGDCVVAAISSTLDQKVQGITCECMVANGYFAVFAVSRSTQTTAIQATSNIGPSIIPTTSETSTCVAPLVETEVCSSDCILRCGNLVKPDLCVQSCELISVCVCPRDLVFNDKNECVHEELCSAGIDVPQLRDRWINILIGCIVGIAITIAVASSLILYKVMHSKKKDLVKPFNDFTVDDRSAAYPPATNLAEKPTQDCPPPYCDQPGCVPHSNMYPEMKM